NADEIAASHYSPQGSGTPILADYIRDFRPAKWGPMINLRSKHLGLAMSALCHARSTASRSSRLFCRQWWCSADAGRCADQGDRDQSTLMFAARMTLAHFSVVSARSLA